MILETLLGSVGGGLLRLAPELLKVFDRKNERKHELEMTHLSIESDKVKSQAQLALQESQASSAYDVGALQALVESIKSQGTPSGVKWIDGVSAAVRPSITFAFFGLYASCRIATFIVASKTGVPALQTLAACWTGEDQVMLAGMLNFWFLGRTLDKK